MHLNGIKIEKSHKTVRSDKYETKRDFNYSRKKQVSRSEAAEITRPAGKSEKTSKLPFYKRI